MYELFNNCMILILGLWLNGGDEKNFEHTPTNDNKRTFFASSHQKRHSKEVLDDQDFSLRQPSSPITQAVHGASLGVKSDFASANDSSRFFSFQYVSNLLRCIFVVAAV